MEKINKIIKIAESDLKLSEKVEALNKNQLELAILFLLLDKKDEFRELLPIKKILDNIDLIKEYNHPKVTQDLFKELINKDEFVLGLMKDFSKFKEFNELSSNQLNQRLTDSLNKDEDFISAVIAQKNLALYKELDIFDNGFINAKLKEEDIKAVLDFIQEYPEYFNQEYFDGQEEIHEVFRPYLSKMAYNGYEGSFLQFTNKYLNEKQLDNFYLQIVPILKLSHLKEILINQDLFNIFLKNQDQQEVLEDKIRSSYKDLIDENISSALLKALESYINEEELSDFLLQKLPLNKIKELYTDKYGTPELIVKAIDAEAIKKGDYTKLKDIENLSDYNLSDEELFKAVYSILLADKYSYFNLDKIAGLERVAEKLGEALIKEDSYDKEDLVYLKLSPDWYVRHFGIAWVLDKYLDDLEDKKEFIKSAIQSNSEEVLDYFKKKIKKSTYWGEANRHALEAVELGVFGPKEVYNLLKQGKLEVNEQTINILNEAQVEKLMENEEDDKIKYLQYNKLNEKTRNKIINSLKDSQIISSYYYKHWINSPLTGEQLQKLWDKVKEKSNRDLKDWMFEFIKHQKSQMTPDLFKEITSRAKKLKGFEDLLMEQSTQGEEFQDLQLLEKKFTKEISTPKGCIGILKDNEFDSILNEKNIERLLKKAHKDLSILLAWLKSDKKSLLQLNHLLSFEKLDDEALNLILNLVHLSDIEKIQLISKVPVEDYLYDMKEDMNLSPALLDKLLNHFKRPERILVKCSQESIENFIKSDSKFKLYLLKVSDYKKYFSPKDEENLLKTLKETLSEEDFYNQINSIYDYRDSEHMVEAFVKYAPKFAKELLDKAYNADFSGESYKKLYMAVANGDEKLEHLVFYKKYFSSQEFLNILKNLKESQLKDFFESRWGKVDVSAFSEIELETLLSVENLSKIPSNYWSAFNLLQKDDLTVEDLDLFFEDKAVLAKLAMLSGEEKNKLLVKLKKTELSLDTLMKIFSLQEILGYDTANIEQLVFQLDGKGITSLLYNFEKYKSYFVSFSDESKNKLLQLLLNTSKEVVDVDKLLVIVPSNSPMRLELIKKSSSEKSLIEVLEVPNLSIEEQMAVAEAIYRHNLKFKLNYVHDEYVFNILNYLIEKDLFDFKEIDNALILFCMGIEVAKMEDNKISYASKLQSDNKQKIAQILKKTAKEYPEQIEGVFFVKDKIFKSTETTLSNSLKEKLQQFSSISSFNNNGEELFKVILKYSSVDKLKAVAKRSIQGSDYPYYRLEVVIDESLLSHRSKNINKNLVSLLEEKEQNIKKLLDKELIASNNRTFGFELEFSANRAKATVASKLRDNAKIHHRVSVKNTYGSSSGSTWDLKVDGSVNAVNGGYSMELASPILKGEEGVKESREVLNTIFNDFKIDTGRATSGGLHVHHDIADLKKMQKDQLEILKQFYVFQESLYSLCDYWRQNNGFCKKISLEDLDSQAIIGRRVGFNLSETHGTMEFRMRENMSDIEAIIRWILLTQKVVDTVAYSLGKKIKEFKTEAEKTLNLIEKEKVLQLKSLENDEMQNQLHKFAQARVFSEIILNSN